MTRRGRRAAHRAIQDRVLHTRIPEPLDHALRERAGQLGLSVSTVVRNALLHTFDLVEGIVTDSAELARALRPPPPPRTSPHTEEERKAEPQVLGWQELTLNCNAVCEHCNALLPRGTRATVGIPVSPRPSFLCLDCLSSLGETSADRGPPTRTPE